MLIRNKFQIFLDAYYKYPPKLRRSKNFANPLKSECNRFVYLRTGHPLRNLGIDLSVFCHHVSDTYPS